MARILLAGCLAAAALGSALAPAVTSSAEGARTEVPLPTGVEVLRDRSYAQPAGPRLDAYVHRGAGEPRPALVVVHGGSWMSGDKESMERVAAAAAERGFSVFNVNYTLAAPGRPGFPVQSRELAQAVRWVREHADRLNVDPARIGVLGTSAGGHLAALLATHAHGRLDSGSRVAAAVTWSAPTALDALRGWLALAVRNFAGCLAQDCDERMAAASPITHVTPDDPPMLILNSRREVVPADQARTLARHLTRAGVRHRLRMLRGDLHGRQYAGRVLDASLRFLVRHLTR